MKPFTVIQVHDNKEISVFKHRERVFSFILMAERLAPNFGKDLKPIPTGRTCLCYILFMKKKRIVWDGMEIFIFFNWNKYKHTFFPLLLKIWIWKSEAHQLSWYFGFNTSIQFGFKFHHINFYNENHKSNLQNSFWNLTNSLIFCWELQLEISDIVFQNCSFKYEEYSRKQNN